MANKSQSKPKLSNVTPIDSGRPATSYDVARHAGVSQSAVSRCFKPGASVSKKMRDRVMKSVKALGYQPNAIARGLITRRSNMVGVIVSNLMFYPEVLTELSKRFTERGVHVLLFTIEHDSDVARTLDQVWQYQVDGVVAAAWLDKDQIEAFNERNVPLVFYNRSFDDMPVTSVCCDQAEGERKLVDLLVDNGHQSFGIISGPKDSFVSVERTQGALGRLQDLGINEITMASGHYTYESGRRALQEIIQQTEEPPDAVICANDMMAIGCMDEARHHLNLDVPGQLSVVGFDGSRSSTWSGYDLVTIQQPVESLAEAAVSMLLDRVDNPTLLPEKRLFSGALRMGTSARIKR
ncbi:MAG: LacI family DNA-binding transcriptional regulator [Pseudomonadota bacterium]